MFRNYFATAFNNLVKHKLYSAINVVGLAVGLAACIVIALYVIEETAYDRHWQDADRIYRMNFTFDIPGGDRLTFAYTPVPAIPALKQAFPDVIEYATRVFGANRIVTIDNREFEENLAIVDPDVTGIFQFDLVAGSFEETFTDILNIAIREDVATRFFGAEDPIGKVLTVSTPAGAQNIVRDYTVTAVYRMPGKSILDIPMLGLISDAVLPPALKSWFSANAQSFLKLREGKDIASIEPFTPGLIDSNVDVSQVFPDADIDASQIESMSFQNIQDAHLESPFDNSRPGGNKVVVYSFAAIAVLVLLIGCINFTILTTAKATQRAREVAMRKVVGAKRKQLIIQFLGESYFIVLLAMVLSLGLVQLGLPLFESLVNKDLALDYLAPVTWMSLLGLAVVVGLLGGLYPAFVLSGFRPGSILKANKSAETRGSMVLRNVLVIFQFTVSIILIIATGVIYAQLAYSTNRDPGFNKDNLLVINQLGPRPEVRARLDTLKQELSALASVTDVAMSQVQPSAQQQNYNIYTKVGEGAGTGYTLATVPVGFDYFATYQIPFLAGRPYDEDRDESLPQFDILTQNIGDGAKQEVIERSMVINASAARELGFAGPADAVGKILNSTTTGNINYEIIGVVADNLIFSINAPPRAEMYPLNVNAYNVVTVRFQGSPERILEQVEQVWKNVMGDVELSTAIVNQLLAAEFQQEETEVRMLVSFSLLAIVIACLGLYGSASFTVDRRIKEIGLRKVMGARVKNIVTLLLWQFSKPVLIANLIAWPLAIYFMLDWLERFSYQIPAWIFAPLCLAAALVALAIAWLTVATNTARVARSNPIIALRYE